MNKLKTVTLNVRLPHAVWKYLKTYCMEQKINDKDLSMNTMIVDLIREHRDKKK